MRPSLPVLFSIAGVVLALDLWTKQWATRVLAGEPPVPILGELVRFTYVRNSGVAFGLGAGLKFPYYVFSIVAVLAIVYLFLRQRVPNHGRRIALALILGGALGNLVDRITTGQVVDFIDIGWGRWHWPVFNVADSAVSIGVVWFAFTWPRHDPVEPEREASALAPAAPPPTSTGASDDAGAGSLGPAGGPTGAPGPLPGRGADGSLA